MPKRIDPALKARAVRLVTEHQQEYPESPLVQWRGFGCLRRNWVVAGAPELAAAGVRVSEAQLGCRGGTGTGGGGGSGV